MDSTGKTTNYTYDDLGRLTKESETDSSITTTKEYTFDKANNRATMKVSKTNEKDYTTTYTYDLNNRLLKEEKVDILTATTTNYVYDENGNQLSKMSYSLTNTTGGGTELGIVVIGDGFNGEESNHVAELSNYDVFNRLIKTQNDKGVILYTYKSDGLRLSKKVNNLLTTHIWDGSNIVLELESGNSVVGKYTRGINLVKNQKGQYFVFNAHGDVVQLTDASGNVVKNYHYDAFGVEENIDKEDSNPFRYCAEYYDKETGTIYLRARYYNPSTGRFISQDPIRSGLNWYTYCFNNPVLLSDPSGMIGILPDGSIYMGSGDTNIDKLLLQYKLDYISAGSNIKKRDEIAKKADSLRKANAGKYKVLAEHKIEDYYIPDITKAIDTFISSNKQNFSYHKNDDTITKLKWFANQVKTGALVDVKNSDERFARQSYSYHILYKGVTLRADSPGNILYGYLGSAARIDISTLIGGAGAYQIYSDAREDLRSGNSKEIPDEIMSLWSKDENGRPLFGDNYGDGVQIAMGVHLYNLDECRSGYGMDYKTYEHLQRQILSAD